MNASTQALKSGSFLLTQADWDAITFNRDRLSQSVAMHEIARSSGDNVIGSIGITDVTRELELSRRALCTANTVLSKAIIVEPATCDSVVDIGTIVTIQRYGSNGSEIGKPTTMKVGGYGSSDTRTKPPTVSYDSILLLSLMGHPIGYSCTVRLANKTVNEIEVVSISLAADVPTVGFVRAA